MERRDRRTWEVVGFRERVIAKAIPRLKGLAVKLATELSFARAAEVIGCLVSGASATTM
ncbi:MAG: hypothetical protein ACPLTR_11825 [Thermacetogeniaceae bacterium]